MPEILMSKNVPVLIYEHQVIGIEMKVNNILLQEELKRNRGTSVF